jgi:hypothetical protein
MWKLELYWTGSGWGLVMVFCGHSDEHFGWHFACIYLFKVLFFCHQFQRGRHANIWSWNCLITGICHRSVRNIKITIGRLIIVCIVATMLNLHMWRHVDAMEKSLHIIDHSILWRPVDQSYTSVALPRERALITHWTTRICERKIILCCWLNCGH